jgi:aquaporin Z
MQNSHVRALAAEFVGTFLLVFLAVGAAIFGISAVVGADGNGPARSLGPALFSGGDALSQVWLFILAPLVGSVIAVGIWMITRSTTAMPEAQVAGSERE